MSDDDDNVIPIREQKLVDKVMERLLSPESAKRLTAHKYDKREWKRKRNHELLVDLLHLWHNSGWTCPHRGMDGGRIQGGDPTYDAVLAYTAIPLLILRFAEQVDKDLFRELTTKTNADRKCPKCGMSLELP